MGTLTASLLLAWLGGPSAPITDHFAGGASRPAAWLRPQTLPVISLVAPGHPGAALRDQVLVRRGRATSGPSALATRRPAHVPAEPPRILNVVRHKLKPGTSHSYESLEAAIVAAYEQAHVPLFWITLQSRTDATDIVYLNVADSLNEWAELPGRYRAAAAAHPELQKMSARLAGFVDRTTSTLTTRRDEMPSGRTGVDLQTMRAMRLAVFNVTAGHEGRFVGAFRETGDRAAPWLLYEANDAPTFVLVAPLRSASRTRDIPPIPRRLQELNDNLPPNDDGVYAVRPHMSRPPKGWRLR